MMRALLALGGALCAASVACSPHASLTDMGRAADAGADGADGAVPSVELPVPDGGVVDWNGWAGDFVRAYCVQCHNPAAPCSSDQCHPSAGPLPGDFRLRDTVVGLAPKIRCGVARQQDPAWGCGAITPEQFPVEMGGNPLPTDEQRDLFVEWIDAGCP